MLELQERVKHGKTWKKTKERDMYDGKRSKEAES